MMVGGGVSVKAPQKAVANAVRKVLAPASKTRVPRNVYNFVKKEMDKAVEDRIIVGSLASMGGASFNTISSSWQDAVCCKIYDNSTTWKEFPNTRVDGLNMGTRTGQQVRIKGIEMYGVIGTGALEYYSDDPYNTVRVILALWDSQIETPMASSGTTISSYVGKKSVSNTSENLIKKYLDKYITLEVTSTEKGGGDGYTPQLKIFKYRKWFKKPIVVTFTGAATPLSDKRLILSMISDSTATSHPGIVHGWYKINYEDA